MVIRLHMLSALLPGSGQPVIKRMLHHNFSTEDHHINRVLSTDVLRFQR